MNDGMPKVSVIVRTKDRPALLQTAVTSVVRQSYRPLQLVVVNDGGEDVEALLSELCLSTSGIELTYLPQNQCCGRAGAANKGLMAAAGTFTLFLDDDDYIDVEHIATLVAAHRQYFTVAKTLGVVHCQARAISLDEQQQECVLSIQGEPIVDDQLFYQNSLPILTVLFPTSVRDLGVRFDEAFSLFEDWDFWLQLSACCTFEFVGSASCAYRIHQDSSGVREYDKQTQAYQQIYRKWLGTLDQQRLAKLITFSHLRHDQAIAMLQAANQVELNRIGQLHDHALSTLTQRDQEIAQLTSLLEAARHEIHLLRKTSPYYLGKRGFHLFYKKCRDFFARID